MTSSCHLRLIRDSIPYGSSRVVKQAVTVIEWQVHFANLHVRMLRHQSPKSTVASESESATILSR